MTEGLIPSRQEPRVKILGQPQNRVQVDRVAQALLSPDQFAKYFLSTDLWYRQEEIMRAVATKSRVAVKACHASSKTFTAARVALWFLARYPEVVVVTTAPTWAQVEKLLWGEIHSALLKSRYPFPKPTMTELKLGPKRYAYGLSTSVTKQDEGVKFQGIHADRVLVILDEAPGVNPKIWEAIEGARAGGQVTVFAIGNPTIASGPFYDAFVDNRTGWVTFTIDAFDTPNLLPLKGRNDQETLERLLKLSEEELDNNVCPYLTTRRWVKEKFYEWGENHPSWQARVRGQFPTQAEDALLSLTWLEKAALSDLVGKGKLKAGLDVAGPGEDETSLTIRRGGEIILHKQWAQSDPRGDVVAALLPYRSELESINVDSIGIGWGMYQHLLDNKFPAIAINVSESSSDTEKYANQKAEFYWGLRMRLASGEMSGLQDEKTIGQLAGIRYKHNPRGQVEIESKDQAAKRGVKSPDRAESIMLAFAERTLVYGVNEFAKQIMKVQSSDMIKPVTVSGQLECPECKAVCVARCSGQWRCNQCGHQWLGVGDKQLSQKPTSRGDMLKKMGSTGTEVPPRSVRVED